MEWFFIIGGIVIWFIWNSSKKQKQEQAYQAATAKIAAIPSLTSRVTREEINLEGRKIDAYKVELKGWLMSNPHSTATSGYFITYLYDQTDGKKLYQESWPVLSTVQSWAEKDSTVLCWKRDTQQVTSDTYYPDWSPIIAIPYALMDWPFRGKRKIGFVTYFCTEQASFRHGFLENKETLLGLAETVKEINFEDIGWKEATENKPRVIELSMELALLVAIADGEITQDEINKIKVWVGTQVSFNEEVAAKEKERFGQYLEEADSATRNNLLDKIKVTNELNEKATKPQKYQALELMLDVMISDDTAEGVEADLIDSVVPLLELDPKTYQDLRETRLSTVKTIATTKEGEDETLFHLTSEMNDSQKCEKLEEEYVTWSGRLALPDKNMSERAKEMCDRITRLRKKYNCQ